MLEPPAPDPFADMPRAIDPLLAGYVAGTLQPHLHALIESHLILSDENREAVRALEARAADEIEAIEPRPLSPAARDAVLGAIYAGGWYGRPRPRKFDPCVPEPLDRLIGMSLDDAPWRFVAPGLVEHVLLEDGRTKAALFKLAAGRRAPRHAHEGREVTLVLKGGFTDEVGHFGRGDVAVADGALDHRPVADADGPCVCFAVTEGAVLLTGPIGRVLRRVFGA